MANRLLDPTIAEQTLGHIRASGKAAAAEWLGVSRPTLDKWIRGALLDVEVEQAMSLQRGKGSSARVVVAEIRRAESAALARTRTTAPPPEEQVIHDAIPVDSIPDDDGEEPPPELPRLTFPMSPVARTGRMGVEEFRDLIDYANRCPDHPGHREAVKINRLLLVEPDLIRSHREANAKPITQEQVRVLVIRVPLQGGEK